MRNLTFVGASALVLALGVASASAEPFNPVTGYNGSTGYSNGYVAPAYGQTRGVNEGRAASEDGFNAGWSNGWTAGSSNLQQFREGK